MANGWDDPTKRAQSFIDNQLNNQDSKDKDRERKQRTTKAQKEYDAVIEHMSDKAKDSITEITDEIEETVKGVRAQMEDIADDISSLFEKYGDDWKKHVGDVFDPKEVDSLMSDLRSGMSDARKLGAGANPEVMKDLEIEEAIAESIRGALEVSTKDFMEEYTRRQEEEAAARKEQMEKEKEERRREKEQEKEEARQAREQEQKEARFNPNSELGRLIKDVQELGPKAALGLAAVQAIEKGVDDIKKSVTDTIETQKELAIGLHESYDVGADQLGDMARWLKSSEFKETVNNEDLAKIVAQYGTDLNGTITNELASVVDIVSNNTGASEDSLNQMVKYMRAQGASDLEIQNQLAQLDTLTEIGADVNAILSASQNYKQYAVGSELSGLTALDSYLAESGMAPADYQGILTAIASHDMSKLSDQDVLTLSKSGLNIADLLENGVAGREQEVALGIARGKQGLYNVSDSAMARSALGVYDATNANAQNAIDNIDQLEAAIENANSRVFEKNGITEGDEFKNLVDNNLGGIKSDTAAIFADHPLLAGFVDKSTDFFVDVLKYLAIMSAVKGGGAAAGTATAAGGGAATATAAGGGAAATGGTVAAGAGTTAATGTATASTASTTATGGAFSSILEGAAPALAGVGAGLAAMFATDKLATARTDATYGEGSTDEVKDIVSKYYRDTGFNLTEDLGVESNGDIIQAINNGLVLDPDGDGTYNRVQGFAKGLDSVPYDGFPAVLHKDERVLTAEQSHAQDEMVDLMKDFMRQFSQAITFLGGKINDQNINVDVAQQPRLSQAGRQ